MDRAYQSLQTPEQNVVHTVKPEKGMLRCAWEAVGVLVVIVWVWGFEFVFYCGLFLHAHYVLQASFKLMFFCLSLPSAGTTGCTPILSCLRYFGEQN